MFRPSTWMPLVLLLFAAARPCAAQDGLLDPPLPDDLAPSPGQAQVVALARTPEMWIYEQERIRYDDPQQAVRRRAELRGAQRAQRLAAMKWYGMSNSRPMVCSTPTMSSYAPYWGSNTYDPHRWRPYSTPSVVVRTVEPRY